MEMESTDDLGPMCDTATGETVENEGVLVVQKARWVGK